MELPLSYVLGGAEEIAKADRPNWRLFRVPHTPSATPQADMIAEDPDTKMPAKWLVSNETNAAKFSAVCYLTAKHISEMLWGDAPFGLIWASWGGTRGEHRVPLFSDELGYWSETHGAAVEAWAPPETKKTCPSAAAMPPEGGPQEYSHLYNGMIHPLTRYSIRGAFWFQGEHNIVTGSSRQEYACTFGAMINAWRDAWTGIGGTAHGLATVWARCRLTQIVAAGRLPLHVGAAGPVHRVCSLRWARRHLDSTARSGGRPATHWPGHDGDGGDNRPRRSEGSGG